MGTIFLEAFALAGSLCGALLAVLDALSGRMPPPSALATAIEDIRMSESHVVLALTGDVLLSPNKSSFSLTELESDPRDYAALLSPVIPAVSAADVSFCNLECPVSLVGSAGIGRAWNFRAAPKTLGALSAAGFDVVSVANNHMLDFGQAAFADTLKNLRAAGLLYTGVSTDGETQEPVVVETKGIRTAFLAYSNVYPADYYQATVRPVRADEKRLKNDIMRARALADLVVVSIHWGCEYETVPTREQVSLGRTMIDLGAAVVAGHHPHVLQEPEFYRGGVIIYSLGNLLFEQGYLKTPDTRLYRVFLDRHGLARVTCIPFRFKPDPWRIEIVPLGILELMKDPADPVCTRKGKVLATQY
jgi:poly-gamma-glutamate synthesis protein (capsule biosynthesis protein)